MRDASYLATKLRKVIEPPRQGLYPAEIKTTIQALAVVTADFWLASSGVPDDRLRTAELAQEIVDAMEAWKIR